MADERLRLIFTADVGSVKRDLAGVQTQIRGLGDTVENTRKTVNNKDQALRELGGTATIAGAALTAAFGAMAVSSMRFEKELSAAGAASGATANEMDRTRAAALEAGRATVFSAAEAAQAETELAKAGLSTADILGGALRGSLDLAAAGQIDVANAAEVAADAMAIFKLKGKDVGHIADVLAAGANKSTTDVAQLSMALKQGGLVASQFGLSLEETVGALSMFATGGLKGSDAGTSFKTMLSRLVPQSAEARGAMEDLGLSFFDGAGRFVGLASAAEQLKTKLGPLSQEQRSLAMNTIFGSDAIRAADLLFRSGAAGVEEWTKNVDDAGAASETAAKMLDNLAGDVEALKGSLETALIGSGSQADGVLRSMTQGATAAVNSFSEMPGPVQGAAAALTGVGGAGLLTLGAIGTLIPRVHEARSALDGMGVAGRRANVALGALGRASAVGTVLIGVAVAIDAVYEALHRAQFGKVNLASLGNALVDLGQKGKAGGELTKQFGRDLDDLGVKALMANDKLKEAMDLGNLSGPMLSFSDDVTDAKRDIEALDKALADMVAGGNADVAASGLKLLTDNLKSQGVEAGALTGLLTNYKDALAEADTQAKLAPPAAQGVTTGLEGVAEAADDAKDSVDGFRSELEDLIGIHVNAEQAEINYRRSLDDLAESVKKNGRTVDINTEAGRKNREALLGVVDAATLTAEHMRRMGRSAEDIQGAMVAHRGDLERVATQSGLTRDQVAHYYDLLDQIPASVLTTIQVNTAAAHNAIEGVARALSRIDRGILTVGGGPVRGHARGGHVMSGVPILVGEEGPELIVPDAGGTVIPAGATAAMLGGGRGGSTTVVNVYVAGSVTAEEDLVDGIYRGLLRKQKRGEALGG